MVRIDGYPASGIAAIHKLCAGPPDGAGCEPTSLREVSGIWRLPFQAAASVAGALGILPLILTAIGLYSVTDYSVVQRRREIGVRLALGASPSHAVRRILAEAWRCVINRRGGWTSHLSDPVTLDRSFCISHRGACPKRLSRCSGTLGTHRDVRVRHSGPRASRITPMWLLRQE